MTDADQPDRDDLADGEVLAAYLDGETDEATSARLERRLATDPALAARLDALAATRARLQRLSDVHAPDDVRQRLRARLAEERAAGTAPTGVADGPRTGRRRWMTTVSPGLAAAVVALVAVVVLGAAAVQLLDLTVSDLGAEGAGLEASGPRDRAADADDGGEVDDLGGQTSGGRAEAGANGSAETAGGAGSSEAAGVPRPAPTVQGDQQIVDRARRQPRRGPAELRARELRLRRRAALDTDRLCVRELDARTVDLVERDGRLVLAVLLDAGEQIVLVDPRTCAPERTIPTGP